MVKENSTQAGGSTQSSFITPALDTQFPNWNKRLQKIWLSANVNPGNLKQIKMLSTFIIYYHNCILGNLHHIYPKFDE